MTIAPEIVVAAIGGLVTLLLAAMRDLAKDRNMWRSMALRGSAVNEKAIDIAAEKRDG